MKNKFYWLKQNGNVSEITREKALLKRKGKIIIWCNANNFNILTGGWINIEHFNKLIERYNSSK